MCPERRWRRYASREDFSPRPAGRAGRTLIDSAYAEIVEGWSAADPGLPRKQRHTAMRVWQRLREPRVRGLVSVGAALGQAVAGAASRGVGGVRAARVGAGDRAGWFPARRARRSRAWSVWCISWWSRTRIRTCGMSRRCRARRRGVCATGWARCSRVSGWRRAWWCSTTPREWGTATRTARSRRP
jgi:hypothetical protein